MVDLVLQVLAHARQVVRDGDAVSAQVLARADVRQHQLLQALFGLLGSFELSFESEGAVEAALGQYADGPADLASCLHAALALMAGKQPLWTFDKAAAKVDGAKLLMV